MPILFLILGATVVAVAAGGRRSSAPGTGGRLPGSRSPIPGGVAIRNPGLAFPVVNIGRIPMASDAAPTIEKFADPIYSCFDGTFEHNVLPDDTLSVPKPPPYNIAANRFGLPRDLGQGYLGEAPNNARDRIARIRAKFGFVPKQLVAFPPNAVGRFAEASSNNIARISSTIFNTYSNAKNYADIAARYGVPIGQVEAQARDIVAAAKDLPPPTLVQYAAKYAPVAQTIGNAVLQYVQTGGSFSTEDAILSLGQVLAAAAGLINPVIGAVAVAAVGLIQADIQKRKAGEAESVRKWTESIQNGFNATTNEGFPVPFHGFDDIGDGDLSARFFLNNIAWGNLVQFRKLSTRDQNFVKRWWSTATTFMSHPDVYNAFQSLGAGTAVYPPFFTPAGDKDDKPPDGGIYGGLVASDEQVMLVAAPIAVANGLDIDDFARRLWNKSKGWRDADETSKVILEKGWRRTEEIADDRSCVGTSGCITGGEYRDIYACAPYVANAWWLQWAVLSRDAFELADSMVAARTTAATAPAAAPPRTPASGGGGILSVLGR